jgi:hypothetical protein
MNFSMPEYERKHNGKGKWEDVSESDLLRDLNEFYGRVTPVLKQIIKGKHVQTSKAIYRLKLRK